LLHTGSVTLIALLPVLSAIDVKAATQNRANASQSELFDEARQSLAKSNYDRAIEIYQRLLRTHGESAPLFLHLGVAHYQKGDYRSAATALERALEMKPNLAAAEAFLGLSEFALGHTDRGRPLLEKSFRSQDPAVDGELKRLIGLRLGKFYIKAGSLDEAEAVYLALLKMEPDNPQVVYQSFWLHMTRAREMMRKLTQKYPSAYLTHEMLGHLLSEGDHFALAAEQFRLALKDNPMATGLHYQIGNMLRALGERKQATHEYEEELRLHPAHAESYFQLGELELLDQKLDKAWTLYSTALQFDPNYADAVLGLAKIQMLKNRPQEALEYCEKAMKLDPANQSAHFLLARVYKSLGRAAEATTHLEWYEKLKNESEREKQYLSSVRAGRPSDR
jgi:protein O-GlcNAc transferase